MALSVDDISALYRSHGRDLLITLTRRTYDPELALDVLAETFAIAFERRRRCRATTSEGQVAWLHGIARNVLLTAWRRGSAERRALMRLGLEPPDAGAEELQRIETLADLRRDTTVLQAALDELDVDQRNAVELRVVQQAEYREIAARLGVSEQVVRARVSRGLR